MKIRDYLIIIGIIILDQVSKVLVTNSLSFLESIKVIDNFFFITLAHNTGAAWSMFSGMQDIFSVVALVVSIGIIIYLNKNKTKTLLKISLLFVVGGAIGNAIDRVIYGYVIDFFDFYIFGYDFPVFNIADSFLTIGMFTLIGLVLFSKDN